MGERRWFVALSLVHAMKYLRTLVVMDENVMSSAWTSSKFRDSEASALFGYKLFGAGRWVRKSYCTSLLSHTLIWIASFFVPLDIGSVFINFPFIFTLFLFMSSYLSWTKNRKLPWIIHAIRKNFKCYNYSSFIKAHYFELLDAAAKNLSKLLFVSSIPAVIISNFKKSDRKPKYLYYMVV